MIIGETETHPFADAFPLLQGPQYAQFRDDIKLHGLKYDELYTYEGKLLDGRNRKIACDELGVRYKLIPFEGSPDQALAFVVSRNLHRRNLEFYERVCLALKLVTLRVGRPKKSARPSQISTADAAALTGVGESTLKAARTMLDRATPEVAQAFETGEISLSAATKLAELERGEQPAALERTLEASNSNRARGAAAAKETKKAANDEQPDALALLLRTITRGVTALGGTVRKLGPDGLVVAMHGCVLEVNVSLKQKAA